MIIQVLDAKHQKRMLEFDVGLKRVLLRVQKFLIGNVNQN